MTKTPLRSKQIWAGVVVTLMGAGAVISEAWALLSYEQTDFLGKLFGPELVTFVGIVMVFLRVVTTTRLAWRNTSRHERKDEGVYRDDA